MLTFTEDDEKAIKELMEFHGVNTFSDLLKTMSGVLLQTGELLLKYERELREKDRTVYYILKSNGGEIRIPHNILQEATPDGLTVIEHFEDPADLSHVLRINTIGKEKVH